VRISTADIAEGFTMSLTADAAWEKAAACDAHAKQTTDQGLRTKFERLRDSWIRIANAAQAAAAKGTSAARKKLADSE
jgi:hypothetical protein